MARPLTIWRYALVELWRLVLLTCSVLVVTIAFAAAVKWYAEGKLGPIETLKFMVLAIPPMLAYALPFAAGFGATLAYHRMAQDNEIIASHAGGVSHRALLVPAAASGLLLAGTLGVLNDQVIPRFLRSMEALITEDLPKILVAAVNRGEAVAFGDIMLHADQAVLLDPREQPGAEGATRWIYLERVAALEFDDERAIQAEGTAESAQVLVRPGEDGDTMAQVILQSVIGTRRGDASTPEPMERVSLSIPLPDQFKDDPKFCTGGELRQLKREPEGMNWVDVLRRDLAHHLAERATTTSVAESLRDSGRVRFENAAGESVVVRAGSIVWSPEDGAWRLRPAADPAGNRNGSVEVEHLRASDPELPGSGGLTLHRAEHVLLSTDMGQGKAQRDLTVRLDLTRVDSRAPGAAADEFGRLRELKFTGLRPGENPLTRYESRSTEELLAEARPRVQGDNADPFLVAPTRTLERKIERLRREITSKQHERWAMAASCFVMVLAGAVTAMRLREALPLTVYLWSFFPALAAVITISSGQQVMHQSGLIGLPILWGGVLGLGVYTLVSYLGLSRR